MDIADWRAPDLGAIDRDALEQLMASGIDRPTSVTLLVVKDLLRQARLEATPPMRDDIGIVLAQHADASAHCARRCGLGGVSATVCGGDAAALHALAYARTQLRRGHVTHVVVGAFGEGAGAAAFLTTMPASPSAQRARFSVRGLSFVRATALDRSAAKEDVDRCVSRALDAAQVDRSRLRAYVSTTQLPDAPLLRKDGRRLRLDIDDDGRDLGVASSGFALARALSELDHEEPGSIGLVVSADGLGGIVSAVVQRA
jgi:hypothetical protein